MNNLSFMEKMLDGVEVEWKVLGGLAENLDSMRKPITSGLREPGEIPYYGASGIVDYVKHYIFDGDFLLVSEDGANLVARNTPIAFSISGKSWVNNHAHILRFNTYVERRFVDIYLNSIDLTPYISGAAQPKLNQKNLNSIQIPIPCPQNPKKSLEIQAEIVRILDAFTAHTAELTAELTARKKQYNYYRDRLLSFEEGEVEWKMLGEISEINTGQKPPEILEKASEFDYINAGTTRSGYAAGSNCEGDTVTTPSRGQGGIGFVGYQKKPFWLGPLCYKMRSLKEDVLINKYLFYFLQSKSELLLALKKEGGVPAVNKSDLAKLEIPLPPINKQKRIVIILDNFDALTNSITEGLPREIKLRQKQYEYYRDLLLSFPKLNSEVAG
ncbi:MAG TPA: restriction endonuclease subunit S [Cellvibrionaceae bacterium]